MSKYEVDVWEYADEFKNLDTNETFGGYAVCELLEQKDQQILELEEQLKKSQNQKAIEELEKLKENAWQSATDISCLLDYAELAKIIDNQIKSLKGEE